MCKSVPQMDATFTLTSTSVRPIWGMATSRISTPGFACGFITAIMVLDIMPPYELWVHRGKLLILALQEVAHLQKDSLFSACCFSTMRRLNSSDLPLGTLIDFHSVERKCLARRTICPQW